MDQKKTFLGGPSSIKSYKVSYKYSTDYLFTTKSNSLESLNVSPQQLAAQNTIFMRIIGKINVPILFRV